MADLPIIHRLIGSRCITLFDMFLFLLAVVFFLCALLVKGNWIRVCFFFFFPFRSGKSLESTTHHRCPIFGRGGSSLTSSQSHAFFWLSLKLFPILRPIKKNLRPPWLLGTPHISLHQRFFFFVSYVEKVFRFHH